MPHQEHEEPLGERLAALEEWKNSQGKFNEYAVMELAEIKGDVKGCAEKIGLIAMAVAKQKSFLSGIAFSFSLLGAGVAIIINNATLWFSNGGHHGP